MISNSSTLQSGVPKQAFPGEIRLFFGHQSVGNNILDGIRNEHPNAKIVAYTQQEIDDQQYGKFHKAIGRNGDPHNTDDGGHSNSEGRHRVAPQFVQLINESRL